jgi:hypothetical protein
LATSTAFSIFSSASKSVSSIIVVTACFPHRANVRYAAMPVTPG